METMEKCRLISKEYNKFTYESTFTKLHSQITNIVSGSFIQSMIMNEYHVFFVSNDKEFYMNHCIRAELFISKT
jgi:hypothetical protein